VTSNGCNWWAQLVGDMCRPCTPGGSARDEVRASQAGTVPGLRHNQLTLSPVHLAGGDSLRSSACVKRCQIQSSRLTPVSLQSAMHALHDAVMPHLLYQATAFQLRLFHVACQDSASNLHTMCMMLNTRYPQHAHLALYVHNGTFTRSTRHLVPLVRPY
jgi:hypothetical protein